MKKTIYLDLRAEVFLKKRVPLAVRNEFYALMNALSKRGILDFPDSRKIKGCKGLYELRVRSKGAWRGLYAYLSGDGIIVLHCFQKKTQETPQKEINTAIKRLKYYC